MKNTLRLMILALVGIFLLTAPALAQENKKIGSLNLSKLFESYEKTKEYQKSLDDKRLSYEKELKDRDQKIKDARAKLAAMKEEEKAKAEKDIEAQEKGLAEFYRSKDTDLKKEEADKTREILLEMEKVISDYAKKEGFDIILNDRVLLYSNPAMDITDPVTKIMNENYNKK